MEFLNAIGGKALALLGATLAEGDFYNAFMYGYAENIRFFADYYEANGTPYDYGTAEDYGSYEYTYEDGLYAVPPGRSLLQTAGLTLPPALIVGFLVSFVMAVNEKKKLTSVHFNKEADAYIRQGSLVITADRARYMYSNVVVTVKPDTNQHSGPSSNAGSHVHVSSGGMSHGGRSGSF